jgi:hypothetical protein
MRSASQQDLSTPYWPDKGDLGDFQELPPFGWDPTLALCCSSVWTGLFATSSNCTSRSCSCGVLLRSPGGAPETWAWESPTRPVVGLECGDGVELLLLQKVHSIKGYQGYNALEGQTQEEDEKMSHNIGATKLRETPRISTVNQLESYQARGSKFVPPCAPN